MPTTRDRYIHRRARGAGLRSLVPRILNSTGTVLARAGHHEDAVASLDDPDTARDFLNQARSLFDELGLAEAEQVRAELANLD